MSGLKGRSPTADEKRWMNKVAIYGCWSCRKNGVMNPHILIHHCEGRTKAGAHFLTIPICDFHHSPYTTEGLHSNIAQWRRKYGRERDIIKELFDHFNEPYPQVLLQ